MLILYLILLAACGEGDISSVETAVPEPIDVVAEESPTEPAAEPTAVPTETAVPEPTDTPKPTNTPAPMLITSADEMVGVWQGTLAGETGYVMYTADGRFYILATIPLDSSILLSTYDPAQNSNPNAIPVPAELPSDPIELGAIIFDYNREAEPHLAEQPANQFSPNLDLLDALIASLVVEL